MNYVLEKVTPEDWERIWRDLESDPKKFAIANKPRIRNYPIRTWAIDRENDSYLFWGPNYSPSAESPDNFSFFYKGHFYWINLYHYGYSGTAVEGAIVKFNTTFDSDLSVFSNKKLSKSAKDAVKQAFKVHRFLGKLTDKHTFEVVFKEEGKSNG